MNTAILFPSRQRFPQNAGMDNGLHSVNCSSKLYGKDIWYTVLTLLRFTVQSTKNIIITSVDYEVKNNTGFYVTENKKIKL